MSRARSKQRAAAASDVEQAFDLELVGHLRALRRVLFRYPVATQAAFSALVAEGRRFAETPEGAALHARLLSAKPTANAQLLWELLSSRTFTERADGALPSTLLDALGRAIRVKALEPLIARALERR